MTTEEVFYGASFNVKKNNRQLTIDCPSAADFLLPKMRSFLAALVLIPAVAVAVAAVETPSLRGEGVEDQASGPLNSTNSVLFVSICRRLHNLVIIPYADICIIL